MRCSALQCVAVCCSMLQYVAVCCSMLQRVRTDCANVDTFKHIRKYVCIRISLSNIHVFEWGCINKCIRMHIVLTQQRIILRITCTPYYCNMLQSVAVRCSALQCVAVRCSALQYVAVRCSVLQCVAVCCNVLQCHTTNHLCALYARIEVNTSTDE